MTKSKKNERGQGLVEYALILVLVSIVVIVVLSLLGPTIGNVFSNVVSSIDNPGSSSLGTAAPATAIPTLAPSFCEGNSGYYFITWNHTTGITLLEEYSNWQSWLNTWPELVVSSGQCP